MGLFVAPSGCVLWLRVGFLELSFPHAFDNNDQNSFYSILVELCCCFLEVDLDPSCPACHLKYLISWGRQKSTLERLTVMIFWKEVELFLFSKKLRNLFFLSSIGFLKVNIPGLFWVVDGTDLGTVVMQPQERDISCIPSVWKNTSSSIGIFLYLTVLFMNMG